MATPQITGPIGGDYILRYRTDKSVKELWFILSWDNGNTFPDTILHQIDPSDTDSVALAMPDYPTSASGDPALDRPSFFGYILARKED